MPKFRKKPIVIEARRFVVHDTYWQQAVADWCGGRLRGMRLEPSERVIQIDTLEGEIEASPGDWIIRGVAGEYYPCKPDIFDASYEEVSS
jgi:hypothetical protein